MSGLGSDDDNTTDTPQGPALLAVSVITTVVALSVTLLRFCVRLRINRSVVWDDYFLGLAMFLGLVGAIFTWVEGANQQSLTTAIEFDYLAQPWLNMGSTLSKVSICLFFLRLVSRVRVWRSVLGVQIVLLLLVNLAYSFTTLLQCRPLEKLWNTDVNGECWSVETQHGIGYFQGAFDVFSGLFIALFPIMVIQDLDIRRNIRWPFYVLSVLSIIIAMLAVVRTYNLSLTYSSAQYPYQLICTILAVVEQNLGIITANIVPISSLCSNRIRPISQALSVAASARDHRERGELETDVVSILSRSSSKASSHAAAGAVRRKSAGSLQLATALAAAGQCHSFDDLESLHNADGGGVEAWPMGIIKTVSVEVTQEDAPDLEIGMDLGEIKRSASRQDWDRQFA